MNAPYYAPPLIDCPVFTEVGFSFEGEGHHKIMTATPLPSLEVLDELLHYDPASGVFRWRKAMRHGQIPAGTIAGYVCPKGYRYIKVNRMLHLAHRVAFKLYHRREPGPEIDHRDTDPSNNRIGNLREASSHGNNCNKKIEIRNTSGVKGVGWNKRKGRWRAQIVVNGKTIHVGYFNAVEAATNAIRSARERLHGAFANHG